jgi:hypothetical protein
MRQKVTQKVMLLLMVALMAIGTLASPVFASAPNIEKVMPGAAGEMPGMIAVTESAEPVGLSLHPQEKDLLDVILEGVFNLLKLPAVGVILGPLIGPLMDKVLLPLIGSAYTATVGVLLPILIPGLAE